MTAPQAALVLTALTSAFWCGIPHAQVSPQVRTPTCIFIGATTRLETPPSNASTLRGIAKRNHPLGFGPPPSQRDLPGSVWNPANEFWYKNSNGEVILHTDTDDAYVYFWKFNVDSQGVRLLDHGLIDCSGGQRK